MKAIRVSNRLMGLFVVVVLVGCGENLGDNQTPELTKYVTESILPTPTITTNPANLVEEDSYFQRRVEMVDDTIEARGVSDPKVLEAMRAVPRHLFVPPDYLEYAYNDNPLPIGYGQTISQPYMVALMTEMLELAPGEKVLEIGTGSGYQAAILAALGGMEVYSVEIIPELAESAANRLKDLGYTDVQVLQADGYYGWLDYAPFDAIIVTAAPDHLPAPLVAQVVEGGRLVVPIGPLGGFQTLWKFVLEKGELKGYNLGWVSFVPFTGSGIAGEEPAPTNEP